MESFGPNFPDFPAIWLGTTKPKLQNRYGAADQMYCKIEQNKTRVVAPSRSRRDHRKSKFGLRHAIKLNSLYGDEVRILIFDDLAENGRGQRPESGSREGQLSNPRGRAAHAMHEFFFFENLRNPARVHRAGAMWQFCPNQVYSRLPMTNHVTNRASWIDSEPSEPSNSTQSGPWSGHTGTNVASFPWANILK
jgi:hypothetical protein